MQQKADNCTAGICLSTQCICCLETGESPDFADAFGNKSRQRQVNPRKPFAGTKLGSLLRFSPMGFPFYRWILEKSSLKHCTFLEKNCGERRAPLGNGTKCCDSIATGHHLSGSTLIQRVESNGLVHKEF